MSDPVSNSEIESVLSSIRRLVSEEPSPLLRRKRIAEAAKERFVLTPALRVSDEDEPEGAGPGQTAGPPESPDDQDQAAETAQQDGAEDAVDASGGDAPGADDAAEDMPPADPAAPVALRPENRLHLAPSSGSPVRKAAAIPRADGERLAAQRQTLEERIAELEAALEHAPDEWEPDGSEVTETGNASLLAFDRAMPRPAGEPSVAEDALEEPPDEPDAGDPDDQGQVLEAEQPEEALDDGAEDTGLDAQAEQSGDSGRHMPETDVEEAAEAAERADENDAAGQSWVDAEDGEAMPDQAASGPDPAQDAGAGEDSEDLFAEDAVLDEDALRDMVAQLVRAELTGALGEQITRNVRRLVRREIQRALAVRDLE